MSGQKLLAIIRTNCRKTKQGYTLKTYFRCAISIDQVKIRMQYRRYRMLDKHNFKIIKLQSYLSI